MVNRSEQLTRTPATGARDEGARKWGKPFESTPKQKNKISSVGFLSLSGSARTSVRGCETKGGKKYKSSSKRELGLPYFLQFSLSFFISFFWVLGFFFLFSLFSVVLYFVGSVLLFSFVFLLEVVERSHTATSLCGAVERECLASRISSHE